MPPGFNVTFKRRLFKKINKEGPVPTHCPHLGKCWVSSHSARTSGHTTIRSSNNSDGRLMYTHRAMWIVVHGMIPESLFVLHKCDNPCCVNPDHLFLGTQADNLADMTAKGRDNRKGNAKLDKEEAAKIRWLYERTNLSQREIAERFDITQPTVSAVICKHRWS